MLCKNLKDVYSGFIPPDMTEMVISWENINLFQVKLKNFLNEMSTLDEMEESSQPRNVRK